MKILGGKEKTFFHVKKSFSLPPKPPILFQKKRGIVPLRCRGRAGISLVGGWRYAKVPRGTVQLYGRIRTSTDSYGRLTCGSTATSRISISRASGATSQLPPACWATAQRQAPQPAGTRGVIAPLFASFVKAAARAWTHVLNRADVRRQGSREQARTPRALFVQKCQFSE